jgi:hypothetical protein
MSDQRLSLVGTASYKGSLGYGEIYHFAVERVLEGSLRERSIELSVLASDRARADFLEAHIGQPIEIVLTRRAENEEYQRAMISGFVDAGRTSWEISTLSIVD